jgi:general secretion pathway protein I
MHPSADRSDAGFTLIESLVAVAVIAVTLASIGALVGGMTRGTRQVEQRVALVQAANSLLWDAMPARTGPVVPVLDGEALGHRWREKVLPAAVGFGPGASDTIWIPLSVELSVEAPGGELLRVQTVRLLRKPPR